MQKVNWNEIQESGEFNNPIPGAYIGVITDVEDVEDRAYLKIAWDFAEGEYKGENRSAFERLDFWPMTIIRSYKPSALGFFKAFKTALESSNRNYTFDEENLSLMRGKYIGVVLGEEGYFNRKGEHKKRLYVAQTRSIEAIQKGDFTVPEYRENDRNGQYQPAPPASGYGMSQSTAFSDDEDDGELPF